MLYGCYIHEEDDAQFELWDSVVCFTRRWCTIWIVGLCCVFYKKMMHNLNCGTLLCVLGRYLQFWFGQMSGLVKKKHGDFLRHHESIKCQTLHDGTSHWALPVHYTLCDLDITSRSQQCHTVLNWKCYVLFWLSWNIARLLSTSSRSWIDNYFGLLHIFKGDNWYVSWFDRNFIVGFFMDTVQAEFFQLCTVITLLGVYQFIIGFMILTLFQGHRCVVFITYVIFFPIFMLSLSPPPPAHCGAFFSWNVHPSITVYTFILSFTSLQYTYMYNVCACVQACGCRCACMFECLRVCICVCVCVYVCVDRKKQKKGCGCSKFFAFTMRLLNNFRSSVIYFSLFARLY